MGDVISTSVIPPFVFAVIIGVPSIILYTLEVFILIKHRKRYNSAFFRLFIARFSLNFIGYFNSFIYARLGRLGVFMEFFETIPPKLLAASFFFCFYAFHAENMATMFILVNRFSLVAMPLNQEKIWKYLLPVSIVWVFVLPLFFTAQNLSYEFYIRHTLGSTTQFTLDFRRHEGEQALIWGPPLYCAIGAQKTGPYIYPNAKQYLESTYIGAISAVLFCIICGVINMVIIILYQKRKKLEITSRQKSEQSMETKLTIYAFITFLSHTLMAVFMILIFIACNDTFWDALFFSTFNQLPWLNDLGTVAIPAWMLLWACTSVRQEVLIIIGLNKSSKEFVFERVNKDKVTNVSLSKITMKV